MLCTTKGYADADLAGAGILFNLDDRADAGVNLNSTINDQPVLLPPPDGKPSYSFRIVNSPPVLVPLEQAFSTLRQPFSIEGPWPHHGIMRPSPGPPVYVKIRFLFIMLACNYFQI